MTQAKKLFLLLLGLAVGQVLVAQTTYSTVQDGSWNEASTWDANGIPPNLIPADATVEINHNIQESFSGGLSKTNNGTININAESILVIYKDFDNYGTINTKGGPTYSEFRIVIATFNNKAGGVLKTSGGPEASITVWNDGVINNEAGGLIEVTTDGELRMVQQGNNTLNNSGTITNSGYILSYGAVVTTAGSKLYNDNASFQTINAPLTIGGEVKLIGASSISVQGNLDIQTGSSIEWVLTSQPSGFNYPYITQSSGTGSYGNVDMKVSLASGFQPDVGAIYNIFLNANSVPTGVVTLPTLAVGKTWKESRAPDFNGIRIEVEEGSGGGGGGGDPGSDMTSVPTMSQWGLILFALLILTLGTITAMQRELTTEGAPNSFSIKHFPFEKSSFIFWLVGTALTLMLVFMVAIVFAGYELTNADIPGSLLAIPIAAYLLHLLFGYKK